jgi:hypothetical protein
MAAQGQVVGLGFAAGGLRLGWFGLFRFGCGREEVVVVAVDGVADGIAPAVGAERLPWPLFERRTLSSEGREKRIHINAKEYGS